ncbi:MAG: hypothetical protein RLN81_12665 [Balneolaceae bacterium]
MSYNNNNNNSNKRDVFLVETEARNGGKGYFKGSFDTGGGKMVEITTFGETVEIGKGRNAGKTAIVARCKKWKRKQQSRNNGSW